MRSGVHAGAAVFARRVSKKQKTKEWPKKKEIMQGIDAAIKSCSDESILRCLVSVVRVRRCSVHVQLTQISSTPPMTDDRDNRFTSTNIRKKLLSFFPEPISDGRSDHPRLATHGLLLNHVLRRIGHPALSLSSQGRPESECGDSARFCKVRRGPAPRHAAYMPGARTLC